jgi:hypothetical protein
MSTASSHTQTPTTPVDLLRSDVAAAVARALSGLRFGAVEIVVHDGRIAHIERRERVRLDEADRRSPDRRTRNEPSPDRACRTAGGADSIPDEDLR